MGARSKASEAIRWVYDINAALVLTGFVITEHRHGRLQARYSLSRWQTSARRRVVSEPRLEYHIEWRICGPPDRGEAAGGDDLAQLCLAGLSAERNADLLRQRGRNADHCGCSIVQTADRV